MAKIINNLRYKKISAKRDRISEKIKFNQSYINIAEQEFSEKSDIKIKQKDMKMRRILFGLEEKAASEKQKMQYLFDEEIKQLKEKQRLPKLAVEQKYKRMLDKNEKEAEGYKKSALEKLDKKLEALKEKWTKRVKEAGDDKNKDALAMYEKVQSEQKQELEEYKQRIQEENAEKVKKLKLDADRKDIELLNKLDALNKKLAELSEEKKGSMKDTNSVLEIEDLVMQFEGLKAVDKLSFEVKEGEIFGLIGPNGAGKTTVFNCITQFNKPTAGQIHYHSSNGEAIDLIEKRVHDVVKLGIVRTFQNLELIWELSVLENMLIGAHSLYSANFADHILHTRKLRREEKIMKARALDVLKRLNLIEYKDVVPYGLPYGILKRIELARTLMVNPRLIILDEPAAGLNEAETEELAETIYKIRKDYNCTIFLVEHDMGLVMDICDTVCAISFGKKLAIGTPDEIQNNPLVQEAYLGGTMTEDDDE